ncbi:DNA-directed RNA polymerase I subunit RPA43 isoform X2 [Arvicanthis niloticus]|uniref:DNA-directed RNA polymerase I subunit RPA43 isoform X2 n=1 Tax=Arvicanthis niloticus TaxID=61156 RepID=UPI00402B7E96
MLSSSVRTPKQPDKPHGCGLCGVSAAQGGLRAARGGSGRGSALPGAAELRRGVCAGEQPLFLLGGRPASQAHRPVAPLPEQEAHGHPRAAGRRAPALLREGTVNKVSSTHIGCLVHGCFNASIPKPEQMSYEEWQTLEINVGDELEFDVFRLDSDSAGVFCIRGKLNTTSLQLKNSVVSEDVAETVIEEVVEKTSKRKKKKNKDTETCATVDSVTEVADITDLTPKEDTDLPCSDNVNDFCEEEPKKKKKKKKRHQEDQDPIFQASDSSGYQSDHKKKKKKRKHSEEAHFESPKKRQ